MARSSPGRIRVPLLVLFSVLFALPVLAGSPTVRPAQSNAVSLEVFDANLHYTSGVVIPVGDYNTQALQPLTGSDWTGAARPVSSAAADGVTLLLLRAVLPSAARDATFTLQPGSDGAGPGSLWAVDDPEVADTSAGGGARNGQAEGPASLTVNALAINGTRYAFALYRSPRDFDAGTATSGQINRTVQLQVASGGASAATTLTVVRPLVVLVHGTWGNSSTWDKFPLWTGSANELVSWNPAGVTLPFYTARVNFDKLDSGAGPVVDTASYVLPKLVAKLEAWREAIGTAASQADVVTHSFGGFVARQIGQTQPDTNPMGSDTSANFRSAGNWGHGLYHKLITLAATHRGSHLANHLAYLNQNGSSPGAVRLTGILAGMPIDKGAVRDQMVLSPALRALKATPVPGHAVVGSGTLEASAQQNSGIASYVTEFSTFYSLDVDNGPYKAAGNIYGQSPYDYNAFTRLSNYIFNLDYGTSTDPSVDPNVTPNYDLTVRSSSAAGNLPRSAFSDANDIAPAQMADLNHTFLHDSQAVSDRVTLLLQQPASSSFFAPFPATADSITAYEEQLSQDYNPVWLNTTTSSAAARGRTGVRPLQDAGPQVQTSATGGQVSTGQPLQVTVTWPGKTLAGALLSWTGQERASHSGPVPAEGGRVSYPLTVPGIQPGRFAVVANAQAADGATAVVVSELQLVDPEGYVELQVHSRRLVLRRATHPPLEVFGRRPDGVWREVEAGDGVSFTSSDPEIVQVEPDGTLRATGFGSATVTVAYPGVQGVTVEVDVTGVPVRTRSLGPARGRAKLSRFAVLGSRAFDVRHLDPATVRIGGKRPVGRGLRFQDVNRDRIRDAVVEVRRRGLEVEARDVRMVAATRRGLLVEGDAELKGRKR